MKKSVILAFLLIIPVSLSAYVMLPFDDPYQGRGLSGNTVIDIITHKGAVWMATGKGLSFSYFNDSTWNIYDNTNGLVTQDISAIYSSGDVLWVAMNHFEEGVDYAFADGLAITADTGFTWDTLMVEGSHGFQKTVYDITGVDSLIFCASWAGGLFASSDDGASWRHIYFSTSDSLEPTQFTNLYFAAVADTLHPDSLILWAGTAGGLMRYVYAPAYAKPSSNYIFDVVSVDSFIFICGDSGLTRLKFDSTNASESYHSSFVEDGLPGMAVTTAFSFGGRLFVGTLDSLGGATTGLAISDDDGLTFHTNYSGLELNWGNKYPRDFASIEHHLFMAAYEAGLYMSSDTGQNWQQIYLDTLIIDTLMPRSIIHSVAADSFNLWVGTDAGLVLLGFDSLGSVMSRQDFVFADNDTSGARSYRVRIQKYTDSLGHVDSTAVWTINHPIDTLNGNYAVYYSRDNGVNWNTVQGYLTSIHFYDIDFINELIFLVGEDVFTQSANAIIWYPRAGQLIKDSMDNTINFSHLNLNSILIKDDTVYIGSEHGLAISPPGIGVFRWRIVIANTDPTHYDKVSNYRYPHLSGNFVNALGIQRLESGQGLIWASTHPDTSEGHFNGISVSPLDSMDWDIRYSGVDCWNYAFNDIEVFAATSSGLLHSPDTGRTWETLTISGRQVTSDPPVDYAIDPSTEVYAVEVIGDTLWVGTKYGAAKIALSDLGNTGWEIFRVDNTPGVYAFPVPFSLTGDDRLFFHYSVPQDAYVTISVYDFAMDLVKTVVDSESRAKGTYNTDYWDGLNGQREAAAIAMYYFKIALSTGETYWGKLALVP